MTTSRHSPSESARAAAICSSVWAAAMTWVSRAALPSSRERRASRSPTAYSCVKVVAAPSSLGVVLHHGCGGLGVGQSQQVLDAVEVVEDQRLVDPRLGADGPGRERPSPRRWT